MVTKSGTKPSFVDCEKLNPVWTSSISKLLNLLYLISDKSWKLKYRFFVGYFFFYTRMQLIFNMIMNEGYRVINFSLFHDKNIKFRNVI